MFTAIKINTQAHMGAYEYAVHTNTHTHTHTHTHTIYTYISKYVFCMQMDLKNMKLYG